MKFIFRLYGLLKIKQVFAFDNRSVKYKTIGLVVVSWQISEADNRMRTRNVKSFKLYFKYNEPILFKVFPHYYKM